MALLCAIWISFVMASILSHQIPLDDVILLTHNKRNDCMQKKTHYSQIFGGKSACNDGQLSYIDCFNDLYSVFCVPTIRCI